MTQQCLQYSSVQLGLFIACYHSFLSAQAVLYKLFLTDSFESNVLIVAIVAGVACGVLLIAIAILVVSVATICIKKARSKRGK